MLQSILRAEDDNEEEEDEAPDDEVINQMIARSNEEFEQFQNMDIQRRREETERSKSLGEERKDRLIQESELPAFFTEMPDDEELLEQEKEKKEIEMGRGNRQRKETNYDDQVREDPISQRFFDIQNFTRHYSFEKNSCNFRPEP